MFKQHSTPEKYSWVKPDQLFVENQRSVQTLRDINGKPIHIKGSRSLQDNGLHTLEKGVLL